MQYRILAATNFIFYMQFQQFLRQSLIWRGLYLITVFVLNIVMSRLLQAEVSGWLYFMIHVFSFVIVVASCNIESGVGYFLASSIIPKEGLTVFVIMWTVIITILLLPILYLYFSVFQGSYKLAINELVFLSAAFIIGGLLTTYCLSLFYADKNVIIPNVALFITNAIFISFLLLSRSDYLSLRIVFKGYCYLVLAQGLIMLCLFLVANSIRFNFGFLNAAQVKQILSYSLIAFGGNLVLFLVYRIDYWFVQRYCSGADLGNYIQASKLGQLLLVIPQVLAAAVFPETASMVNTEQIGRDIVILFRLIIQCFIVGYVFIIVFGKWVLLFLFGNTFSNIYLPVLMLIPGILCLSILVILLSFFSGKQQSKHNFNGAMIALVVIALGDFILIPIYGIYAAAIVSTLGYCSNLIYALWQFKKLHSFNFKQLFLFTKNDWYWLASVLRK
ncbi:MAG: polysaccharide biosynthesis C-terminal domain-containing protein [Flavobacterium sp.]|nr:polysaccharide biosynthesis C-terminal domain-containing protein [Flavobacterium sp.]